MRRRTLFASLAMIVGILAYAACAPTPGHDAATAPKKADDIGRHSGETYGDGFKDGYHEFIDYVPLPITPWDSGYHAGIDKAFADRRAKDSAQKKGTP
jgi:hypothetical protein